LRKKHERRILIARSAVQACALSVGALVALRQPYRSDNARELGLGVRIATAG
jgi:hypothetical protein